MSFHDLDRIEEKESPGAEKKQDNRAADDDRERLERLLYGSLESSADGPGNGPGNCAGERWQPYLIGVAATLFLVGFWNILQPLQKEPAPRRVAVPLQSADPFPVSSIPSSTMYTSSGVVPGFSAQKVGLTGIIDSRTLSASYYWTLVLKNDSMSRQEGVATLHLPEGAVVSRATDWVNGIPQEAAFNAKARVNRAYETVVAERREPLLVDLNKDKTVTIKAFPVNPNGGRMKIRLGITAPVTVDESGMCSIEAPYLMSSNFDASRKEEVHIESDSNIGMAMIDSATEDFVTQKMNDHVLAEQLDQSQLSRLRVISESRADQFEFAVRATHATKGHYICAGLKRRADGKGFVVDLSRTSTSPKLPIVNDEHAAFRLSSLWAAKEVDRLIETRGVDAAERVATIYRLVTPVTSAVVFESSGDYDRFGLHRKRYSVLGDEPGTRMASVAPRPSSDSEFQDGTLSGIDPQLDSQAPTMQGATNGIIGPQGLDATYITGVNTAGTAVAFDRTILDLVPFANAAMCFAGLLIAIFTFANERGSKWAQLPGFMRKERGPA